MPKSRAPWLDCRLQQICLLNRINPWADYVKFLSGLHWLKIGSIELPSKKLWIQNFHKFLNQSDCFWLYIVLFGEKNPSGWCDIISTKGGFFSESTDVVLSLKNWIFGSFKAVPARRSCPPCPNKPLSCQIWRHPQFLRKFQTPKFKFSSSGK